jgi:two-component system response regulator HydG
MRNGGNTIPKVRVLVVDDDADTDRAHALANTLGHDGYLCELARSGVAALECVDRVACDIVICDVRTGDMGTMELLDRLKKLHPGLPVIVVSTASGIGEAVDAVKHGAFQYLTKPCNVTAPRDFVAEATDWQSRSKGSPARGRESPEWDGELVQKSPAMRALVEAIALVAVSSVPVLIVGESGTGKERVARAIHGGGSRREQPFVAVNTSALPEHLLESELFGHVRGAFTGATHARRGLLAEANGGTLLLDEIGDMPVAIQPKLLRVLQFGEARPVGSDRTRHVDVRVIAATHRDLDVLVRDGLFREDLRYRLNVIPLLVPPLRDRSEDIPALATHFLEKARERTSGSPVTSISDEAMHLLRQASWLGNVRELENTIERLVVLGRGPTIAASDLAFLEAAPGKEPWPPTRRGRPTIKQLNERYLTWMLEQTGGDKVRAAEILGINLSTLYRWQRARS